MKRDDFQKTVERVKASIQIRSLFERDGHKMTNAGGLLKCCCPFHRERTPSCVVYSDHFHCFGCCQRGDAFDYWMKSRNCDFKTALAALSGELPKGVVTWSAIRKPARTEPEMPPYYFMDMLTPWIHETMESIGGGCAMIALAESLGISAKSLLCLTTCITDNADYAFPMFDHTRHPIGIRLRDVLGKKWAVKGSKQGLFIPITEPEKLLYVTEGPTDCAAMLDMGLFAIGKAAAMQGPEEIVKFIERHRIKRVVIIADNDPAGLRGSKKLVDACPVPCCEVVLPAKDAREFYINGGTGDLIQTLVDTAVWNRPKHA